MISLLLGLAIGTVLGLTGAGGSVFAVPLLVLLLGLPIQQAIGLSLAAVGASALFGLSLKLRSGQIQWLPAIVFSLLGGLGAPVGSWLNRQIDERVLSLAFIALVLFVALRMWILASRKPEDARIVRAGANDEADQGGAICRINQGRKFEIGVPCVLGMSGGALLTGVVSGLFGVGGGFLIVPILIFLTSISMQQAVATSLVIISFISVSGFVSFLSFGNTLDFSLALPLAGGGIGGMIIGVLASRYIASALLQKIFAVMLLAIIATYLFTIFN